MVAFWVAFWVEAKGPMKATGPGRLKSTPPAARFEGPGGRRCAPAPSGTPFRLARGSPARPSPNVRRLHSGSHVPEALTSCATLQGVDSRVTAFSHVGR